MRNKRSAIPFFLSLSFMIALAAISLFVSSRDGRYLAAFPKAGGAPIEIEALENLNGHSLTLTYANEYHPSVQALNSNYPAVVTGTNHTYPLVMGYGITNGAFFNKNALNGKRNTAVLNEKAAFELFGTLNVIGNQIQIDRKPYLVTGVMDDNDEENLAVYVPATCFSDTAGTIMAGIAADGGVTEAYAANELKKAGVNGLNYDFINLPEMIEMINHIAGTAFMIALIGIAALAVKKTAVLIAYNKGEIKRLRQIDYFAEILKAKSKPVQKLFAALMIAFGMIAAAFALLLRLFETFLRWNSLREALANVHYAGFLPGVAEAEQFYLLSNVLLVGFAVMFVRFIATVFSQSKYFSRPRACIPPCP